MVKDMPTATHWFNEMNAISRGVEARLDSLVGFSGMVTLETIAIARQLRMPERQIKSWADSRFKVQCSTRGQISPAQSCSKRGG